MNVGKRKQIVFGALALVACLAAGAAQAHTDVQWSVSIGGPVGVSVYSQPRVIAAPVRVAPVVVVPRAVTRPVVMRDSDRDGIPDRYDRVHNPRWDRDGDGVPNRYDRNDRHDPRGHGPRHDHDHDGMPDRRDPRRGR